MEVIMSIKVHHILLDVKYVCSTVDSKYYHLV